MSTPNNKLSVRVDGNQISFYSPNDPDDNIIITFHRTLRIPDDGKIYPLPPSLGNFPVKRVDDYLDRVPEKWKKTGGIFIPLYQREAMWMEFLNVSSEHPHALKVAVGKVNALSGEMWDEEMKDRSVQDYVVTPLQPWLDGINSGDGTIKQFIAMPLGQGYTVESQVTGEDKVGGAQIICFNPNEQKRKRQFAPQEPVRSVPQQPKPIYQPQVLFTPPSMTSPPPPTSFGFSMVSPQPPQGYQQHSVVPCCELVNLGSYEKQACDSIQSLSFDCCESEESYAPPSAPSYQNSYSSQPSSSSSLVSDFFGATISSTATTLSKPPSNSAPKMRKSSDSKSERKKENSSVSSSVKAQELGLASGGKMKQQIIEDPYGAEFWDVSTKARVFIHIVNSEMFAQITGESVPPTPISAQTYSSYNYPWFDHYTENVGTIGKSEILSGVKSVKQIDEEKYAWSQQDDSTVKINNVVTHKETFDKNSVRDGDW